MGYIDGFVIAVPAANRQAFLEHANAADQLFLAHGATRVIEAWGDDVPDGVTTDFRKAVKAEDGEVVVFAWIEWPDKATRDAGMKAAMEDERMKAVPAMPFDGKRMIFGGFSTVVSLEK
jgi:uncharacterized protein YbaA (DUF1428 family)